MQTESKPKLTELMRSPSCKTNRKSKLPMRNMGSGSAPEPCAHTHTHTRTCTHAQHVHGAQHTCEQTQGAYTAHGTHLLWLKAHARSCTLLAQQKIAATARAALPRSEFQRLEAEAVTAARAQLNFAEWNMNHRMEHESQFYQFVFNCPSNSPVVSHWYICYKIKLHCTYVTCACSQFHYALAHS